MPLKCTEKDYFDLPCSPYPASGEVTIQGEIHPPKDDESDNNGTDDYIVYNRCLVFTIPEKKGALTIAKRFNAAGKARRLGSVPPIWSNWHNRTMWDDEPDKRQPRLVGISYEGVPNGVDAKKFPTECGRMAVLISGAASIVVDKRYLDNPTFGDYLEWLPADSGGRIRPGAEKYGTCIVRNIKREDLQGAIRSSKSILDRSFNTEMTPDEMERLLASADEGGVDFPYEAPFSKMSAQIKAAYDELDPTEKNFFDTHLSVKTKSKLDVAMAASKQSARVSYALEEGDLNHVKTTLKDEDVDMSRIFGIFLESVPGSNEIRVLLRPHPAC
jgi:hypothetical protein